MERLSPVASSMDRHDSNGIGHAPDRPVSDVLISEASATSNRSRTLAHSGGGVVEWLHYSVDWVWDHSSRKKPLLPVIRMGDGALRYRASGIEAFIDERERIKVPCVAAQDEGRSLPPL